MLLANDFVVPTRLKVNAFIGPFEFLIYSLSVGRLVNVLSVEMTGASEGTRTLDLRFTKPMLYQLSYAG